MGGDALLVSGSVQDNRMEEHSADFEPPSDYELAANLMKALVTQDRVWFGLGAETPDREKLDRLNELLRAIGELGASDIVDTRKAQDHRKRLQSGPAVSLEARIRQIDESKRKYGFVAMKARFTCECAGLDEVGAQSAGPVHPATGVRLDLSGVIVRVDLPASKVKPEVEGTFRHGRTLEDLMIFGTIVDWSGSSGTPPTLQIAPLVASLSWTET